MRRARVRPTVARGRCGAGRLGSGAGGAGGAQTRGSWAPRADAHRGALMASADGATREAALPAPPAPPAPPATAPSAPGAPDSPEGATLAQINALGRRGHAWLESKPITSEHLSDWAARIVNVEGVGRLLDLDTEAAGWPWVGPWPLEPLGAPPESLLHSLSPELLVVVAEHVLGPPCLPRPHGDAQPGHADGARVQSRARARHGAWCLHQFLLSCEHVYRTITRFAMHARVEAGARMLINVGPTLHAPHPLAHTRHLERSARSALEFTAFSVALTQGVFKPCAEETYGHEWARMHTNLVVGFARLGFRKNALLARALERRDLALRHTHLGTNCTIQCTVHGGGAIVRAFDRPSKAWRHFHIQPANDHDRRGPVLPIIDVGDPNEPRITHYAPPAPYSWLSCLRACANTHWAVFAGMCVPDAVIAQNRDSFDESQWKWWIAIYNLHTGERLVTLETEPSGGSMKQMWMCVADDARTLELFALYVLPRDAHDLVGAEEFILGGQVDALLGHAVEAAQVALLGEGYPQVVVVSPEGVLQRAGAIRDGLVAQPSPERLHALARRRGVAPFLLTSPRWFFVLRHARGGLRVTHRAVRALRGRPMVVHALAPPAVGDALLGCGRIGAARRDPAAPPEPRRGGRGDAATRVLRDESPECPSHPIPPGGAGSNAVRA